MVTRPAFSLTPSAESSSESFADVSADPGTTLTATRRHVLASLGCVATAAAGGSIAGPARAADTRRVDLVLIEGLSGPFADAGDAVTRNLRFAIDRLNARAPKVGDDTLQLRLVPLDGKGSIEDSIATLRAAIDRGATFVAQGNSSSVAAALLSAVDRHNQREPDRRVLFLNYSAIDPALTESACSPWHFRFDTHADMKMTALAGSLADETSVKRVFLLNQDYAFGHRFAQSARERLARLRPDIDIVADERIPIGRVKDFAPWATRIRASGADAVMTGNWGSDLTLLVRAARDAGLPVRFHTFFGNGLGAPVAIGEAGAGRVRAVAEWHPDAGIAPMQAEYDAFRRTTADPAKHYLLARMGMMVEMLAAAIAAAGVADAGAVARALEDREIDHRGLRFRMRGADHQVINDLFVMSMDRTGAAGVTQDVEGSGYGFRTERRWRADALAPRIACTMKRP